MLFTSTRFIVFLAITLVVLALLRHRDHKKHALAVASCFFYAAWDWRYLGLLLTVSVIDYVAASRIAATDVRRAKRAWLALSVVSNLSILAYFKYANFFIDNFNALTSEFGFTLPGLNLILPAGISFYTFKTMSYTIDVYRGELAPCKSWLDYATFITFFPELIAGPIVRASVFLPQMGRSIGPSRERLAAGASLFMQGVVKKLFIADRMASIADPVFATPGVFDTPTTWCAVIAYTIQIYCDFSGYSDMAIGTARMIGYDLPENFNMPYLSRSVTEFWRRWHMTLSTWLKDYLYIPLGGNRHGTLMTYRNLFLTMLLGGLWHGASWNFVAWGGLHGLALAVHKLWTKHGPRRALLPAGAATAIAWAATLLFVMVTWVPFRAGSFHDTITILKAMVGAPAGHYHWVSSWLPDCVAMCVVGHLLGLCIQGKLESGLVPAVVDKAWALLGVRVEHHPVSGSFGFPRRVTIAGAYAACMVVLILVLFAPLKMNPFIYFQF